MNFTKLSIETKALLDRYLDQNPLYAEYYGSELNFANLAVWKDADQIESAEHPGKFVILRAINQEVECYFPPVAKNWADFESALWWMEQNSTERNIPFIVRGLTEAMAEHLKDLKLGYSVSEDRDMFEYLYASEDLRTLSGKKFHNKRNLVNQFLKQNEYVFRPYEDADYHLVLALLSRWEEQKFHSFEHKAILKTLDCLDCYGCFADLLLIENRLAAFAIGTKTPKMGVVLFEKADTDFTGSYAAINTLFAQKNFADVPLVNRQEDLGIAELRRAKLSYNPIGFAKKFVLIRNRLTPQDVEQMKTLYHEAFDDSEGFLDYFFHQKYKPENVVLHKEDHTIVSALHFIPKTLSLYGKTLEAPFIVAAATLKTHRGQGIMHSLLKKAFLELQNRNITLCGLSPFSEAFYAQSGFVTVNRTESTTLSIPRNGLYDYRSADEQNMDLVKRLYAEKTKNAGIFVLRDDAYWQAFLTEVFADNGEIILVLRHGNPIGYFTLFASGAEELCFPDESLIPTVDRFDGLSLSRLGRQGREAHAMIRIVHVKKFLTEFPFDPALNVVKRIKITDQTFSSGTVVVELTVRDGHGYLRDIEEFEEEWTIEGLTEQVFVTGSELFPQPDVVIFDQY